MQEIFDRRHANLRLLGKRFRSQIELSNRTGVNRIYINQMLREQDSRKISEKIARRIESNLGLPENWMDDANVSVNLGDQSAQKSVRLLPLLPFVGLDGVSLPASSDENVAVVDYDGSAQSFATVADTHDLWAVPEGSTLIVDPSEMPRNGDIVVIVNRTWGGAYIRRLQFTPSQRRIASDIPSESTEIPPDAQIVGVVRAIQMRMR